MSLKKNGGFNPEDVQYIIGDNEIHLFFPDGRVYYSSHNNDTESEKESFKRVEENLWVADANEKPCYAIRFVDGKPRYYSVGAVLGPTVETKEIVITKGSYLNDWDVVVNALEEESYGWYTRAEPGVYPADENGVATVGDIMVVFTDTKTYFLEEADLTQLSDEEIEELEANI